MRSPHFNRLLPLFVIVVFAVSSANAQDYQKKEKTIGIELGYTTFNKSALTGISFSYRFNRYLRVSPNVQYVFRNKHTDGFIINVDAHVPFQLKGSPIQLYPIGGVTYSSWNHHDFELTRSISDDVSTRESKFGINLGGGVGMKFTGHLRLFAEARYSLVRDYNTTMILAGIAYSF